MGVLLQIGRRAGMGDKIYSRFSRDQSSWQKDISTVHQTHGVQCFLARHLALYTYQSCGEAQGLPAAGYRARGSYFFFVLAWLASSVCLLSGRPPGHSSSHFDPGRRDNNTTTHADRHTDIHGDTHARLPRQRQMTSWPGIMEETAYSLQPKAYSPTVQSGAQVGGQVKEGEKEKRCEEKEKGCEGCISYVPRTMSPSTSLALFCMARSLSKLGYGRDRSFMWPLLSTLLLGWYWMLWRNTSGRNRTD